MFWKTTEHDSETMYTQNCILFHLLIFIVVEAQETSCFLHLKATFNSYNMFYFSYLEFVSRSLYGATEQLPEKSLNGESGRKVRHDKEEVTSISANKIPKWKPAPLRLPAIKERKLVVGGERIHVNPHAASESWFLNLICRSGSIMWVRSSNRRLKPSFTHILLAFGPHQAWYFPSSGDFNYQRWEQKHTITLSRVYLLVNF